VPAATSRPGRGHPQHSGTPGFTIYETRSSRTGSFLIMEGDRECEASGIPGRV